MLISLLAIFAVFSVCTPVLAHTSSQAFVMLLPTDVYIGSGVIAVVLTFLVLALPRLGTRLKWLPHIALFTTPSANIATITSLLSLFILLIAIAAGFTGSRDPLLNPLPLLVWTIWWVSLVIINGIFGNLWHWLNPFTGLYHLVFGRHGPAPWLQMHEKAGVFPAVILFILFSCFMLANPAPDDPDKLAVIVAGYTLFTFSGMLAFGKDKWLARVEFITVIMTFFSRASIFGIRDGKFQIGLPGWKLQHLAKPGILSAVLVLLILGTSSFDGFNETFLWLVALDINPLEFPGRSAIITETVTGVLAANAVLLVVFAACVWSGLKIAGEQGLFKTAFTRLAFTVLPIAAGYHFAHYLTAFMVNIQYTLATMSDPFGNGSDLLGLGVFYVTTGFFNTQDTVKMIFLSQAFAVVIGHVVSILAAHVTMADLIRDKTKVVSSQIPMAIFMIFYTLFGLWLLAAPRGA